MPHRFNRDNGQTRSGQRYDRRHQLARAAAARQHNENNPCARCHKKLGPMGPWLHYDHDEHGGYLGFSHAQCNKQAAAKKGSAIAHTQHRTVRSDWRNWI